MDISLFEDLSVENHKINQGNLSFTFVDIMSLLKVKHHIEPSIEYIFENNDLLGYCIYYFSDVNTVQISQICLKKEKQNQGLGAQLLQRFNNYNITADIAIDNIQSQKFFHKNGFNLIFNQEKNRYRAEKRF